MELVNINGITIKYSKEQENNIEEIKKIILKNSFLFSGFATNKSNVEVNIDDFYTLVKEIVSKTIQNKDLKKLLSQPETLPSCHVQFLIMNSSKENETLIELNNDITEEMLYFIIATKYYKQDADKITSFLIRDNEKEKEEMIEWLKNSQRFNTYNYLLDVSLKYLQQYDFSLFENLDSIINRITKDDIDYITLTANEEKKGLNLSLLSADEFDKLFKGFLIYIKAPQDWKNDYTVLKINELIKFKYNPKVDDGSCFVDEIDGKRKIKIESDGTIRTFITFVHEFMHYISLEKGESQFSISEFPPIFYECIAAQYLVSVLYDEDVLREVINKRKSNNFDIFSSQITLLSHISRYKNKGPIKREELIEQSEKIRVTMNEFKINMSKILKDDGKDIPDFLLDFLNYDSGKIVDNDCDRNIDEFIKYGLLILNGLQYVVGSILVYDILELSDDNINEKMIHVTNNLCDYTLSSVIDYFGIKPFNDDEINHKKTLTKGKSDNRGNK